MTESRINIKTLSKLVGVAPSTVSRILSGKTQQSRISAETAAKVLEKAKELGFRPNYFAHSLNTRKTFNLGLIMANKVDAYLGSVIEGVESRLRDTEYQMVLATCENSSELERKELERMLYRQVDGIIFYPSAPTETDRAQQEYLNEIAVSRLPLVIIGRNVDIHADKVFFADYQAGADAAQEFLSAGCCRFGVVDMPQASVHDRQRLQGYVETLRKNGVPKDAIIETTLTLDTPEESVRPLLMIDCLWGINTAQVLNAATALSRLRNISGLRLRGLGVEQFLELLPFHITMQPMPSRLLGHTAATLLLERINAEESLAPRTVVLPWPSLAV